MKKLIGLVAILAAASVAMADTANVTLTVAGACAVTSSPIVASGTLEKIEVSQWANSTNTIVIATYSGTTALETFASLTANTASTKLIRPSFLPTDNTGTALTATEAGTNSSTQIIIPYRQTMLGGNMKMIVTSGTGSITTGDVSAVIYYTPTKK